ncbi:MAG: cell division protein CrgA [Actinomycetaceae bacterium]|nr:cell division protein CrgA [Actinomycetaceae bacterium]
MPESKKRKKKGQTVQAEDTSIPSWTDNIPLSPTWWAPVFITLMLLGLVWLVVVYMTNFAYPIPKAGNWNLAVGFGLIFVGFLMTLRWR